MRVTSGIPVYLLAKEYDNPVADESKLGRDFSGLRTSLASPTSIYCCMYNPQCKGNEKASRRRFIQHFTRLYRGASATT